MTFITKKIIINHKLYYKNIYKHLIVKKNQKLFLWKSNERERGEWEESGKWNEMKIVGKGILGIQVKCFSKFSKYYQTPIFFFTLKTLLRIFRVRNTFKKHC